MIVEIFSSLMRDLDTQVHEATSPHYFSSKCCSLRHIKYTSKNQKHRENPKSSKKIKISTYNVTPIRLSADFSEETTDQKRARWYVQCAELKKERKKERQPAKSTLSGLFFRNKGEIKILPNKQKLVAFINHH